MARHSAPTGGMTMIEVLVVLGIMAVLAAMVVPVFRALQLRHQAGACANNLKNIGQALLMYRADHMGFPPDAKEWWDQSKGLHGLGLSQLYYGYWAYATSVVRPNGDSNFNWSSTGASGYQEIDEGVVQPDPGDPGDRVSASTAENDAVAAFDMETVAAVGAVTEVDVWVYCQAEAGGDAEVAVNLPNPNPPAQSLNPGDTYGWRRVTWSGEWTQASLDAMVVRFTARTAEAGQTVRVATVFVEVTYSLGAAVVAPGNYLRDVRMLHCPRAPADEPDYTDWPYLGGYNVYDWNYRRDRWHHSDLTQNTWGAEQGLRDLKQPFPPDNTVVTWCPRHRDTPPPDGTTLGGIRAGDHDLVLWVDGSVSNFVTTPSRDDQYVAEQPR